MKPLPLLTLMALAALPAAALAAAPAPQPDPEATASYNRMAARLARARTMAFTVVLIRSGPGALPPLTISGRFEKPNKLAVQFRRDGREIAEAYSDGRIQYLFDPQANRYLRHALGYGPNLTDRAAGNLYAIPPGQSSAPATLRLPPTLFGGDAFSLLQSLSQVNAALAFYRDKDPLNPPEPLPPPPSPQSFPQYGEATSTFSLTERYTSCARETLDGETVLHLHGRNVLAALPGQKRPAPPPSGMTDYGRIEWYLDAATGLPRRRTDTLELYKQTFHSEQDYTTMQVGDAPLAPAAFTWTPPPGAQLVRMESIPPPEPPRLLY